MTNVFRKKHTHSTHKNTIMDLFSWAGPEEEQISTKHIVPVSVNKRLLIHGLYYILECGLYWLLAHPAAVSNMLGTKLSPLFLTNIFILKCLLVEHKTPPTILWGPFSVQGGLKWRNISHRGHRFNIWGDSSNHHLVTTSKMRLKASAGDCLIYHIIGRLHSNSSKQRGRM